MTPTVRHFLLSLGMEYDWNEPLAPYSLRNVLFALRPPTGLNYPFILDELRLFVLLVGEGQHEFWLEIEYQPFSDDDNDEDVEPEFVAAYGPFVARFGSTRINLARGWHVRAVPFDRPGWYEFRLLHEGVVLAEELIQLEA